MLITLQQLKSSLKAVKNYIYNVMPKKVSDLQNDSGYLTQHQDISGKANVSDLTTVATTGSYNDLSNKPQINGIILSGNKTGNDLGLNMIHTDTTANWNAQRDLISQYEHIYIYSDYKIVEGVSIPAMKIGDGTSYLIDMPFVIDGNQESHITEEERTFWNNKVTCFISQGNSETIVFTKEDQNA